MSSTTRDRYELLTKIHESDSGTVFKGTFNGRPAIFKRLASGLCTPSGLARFRFEYDVASQFSSELIPIALGYLELDGTPIQVYEDINATSLSKLIKTGETIGLTALLETAIALTRAIGEIHRAKLIHKDINPNNVVVNFEHKRLQIIDFGISSRLDRESQALESLGKMEGTINYISPEQTGRINRGIDYRSDFFSLGATLYHVATGKLPFPGDDPAEIIHRILAANPPSVRDVRPDLPEMFAEITARLLQKDPDRRYVSAVGIQRDLERCLGQLGDPAGDLRFELGAWDQSAKFEMPETLYGREAEVAQLLATFARVTRGGNELVQVSGPSGIGKSSLVSEIRTSLASTRGRYVAGKFDQFKRNIPFYGVAQAFSRLVLQILKEDEATIDAIRERVLAGIGDEPSLLVEIVPNLEMLIGKPKPTAVSVNPDTFTSRFQHQVRCFVAAVSREGSPLALFLDDMQWADSGSLEVLSALTHPAGPKYLLVIGAFRDNEVGPSHPYAMTVAEIARSGCTVTTLSVGPMNQPSVAQFLAATVKGRLEDVQELATAVVEKTGGNAFFVRTFLKHLYESELIRFAYADGRWVWDTTKIANLAVTDNVVQLLLQKMSKLGPDTTRALNVGACIGAQFDFKTLVLLLKDEPRRIARSMWAAIQEGFLVANEDELKVLLNEGEAGPDGSQRGPSRLTFRFSHDRVQQAAHQLLPDEDRRQIHHSIGQLLLGMLSADEQRERLFEIVDHLNYGGQTNLDRDSAKRTAKLNAAAGEQARQAGAYSSACLYFRTSIELLGAGGWSEDYDLIAGASVGLAKALKSSNKYREAIDVVETVIKMVKTPMERAVAFELLAGIFELEVKWNECIDACLKGLQELGIRFNPKVSDLKLGATLVFFRLFRLKGTVRYFSLLKPMGPNPRWSMILELITRAAIAAFTANQNLFPLLFLRTLGIARREGVYIDNPNVGMAIAMIAVSLRARKEAIELRRACFVQKERNPVFSKAGFFEAADCRWTMPLMGAAYEQSVEAGEVSFKKSIEGGEIGFAGCPAFLTMLNSIHGGFRFQHLVELGDRLSHFFLEVNPENSYYGHFFAVNQAIRALAGQTVARDSFTDKKVAQADIEAICWRTAGGRSIYRTMTSWVAFANGDYRKAVVTQTTNLVHKVLPGCMSAGLGLVVIALSLLRSHFVGKPILKSRLLTRLACKVCLLDLRWWSANEHWGAGLREMVQAEYSRFIGDRERALVGYELAAKRFSASKSYFWMVMAQEAMGLLYKDLGLHRPAALYLNDAIEKAEQFGLPPKAAAMREEFGKYIDLNLDSLGTAGAAGSVKSITAKTAGTMHKGGLSLDLDSIVKASQTISGQIDMGRLLTDILHISMQNAGATHGCLLAARGGSMVIKVVGSMNAGTFDGRVVDDELDAAAELRAPPSIVKFVVRSKETVVLNDLAGDSEFQADPYVKKWRPKSIIAMPIVNQGEIIAVLFLDNRLAENAFTASRVKTLEILAAQGAISLRNAGFVAAVRESSARISTLKGQLEKILAGTKDMAASPSSEAAIGIALRTMAEEIPRFRAANCKVAIRDVAHGTMMVCDITREGKFNEAGRVSFEQGGDRWRQYLGRDEISQADQRSLVVPITWQGQTIGLLILENLDDSSLSSEEQQFIATLTQSLGLSLRNIEHSENLESLVVQRTAELQAALKEVRERQEKIQIIFDNIDQGILTFDETFAIEPEFSAFLTKIFEVPAAEIGRQNILKMMFARSNVPADALHRIEEALRVMVGEDEVNYLLNSSALPSEVTLTVGGAAKILALDWKPMKLDDVVVKMMVTLRDISGHRALEAQVGLQKAQQTRKLEVVSRMLSVERVQLGDYMTDTRGQLARVDILLMRTPCDVERIFMDLHTIKGNSRNLKFGDLATLVHEAESELQRVRTNEVQAVAGLKARVDDLARAFSYFEEVYRDVFGQAGADAGGTWSLHAFASQVFPGVCEHVASENLTVARFDICDRIAKWDGGIRSKVSLMLTHCVNNAVDHGYILPKKRGSSTGAVEIRISAERTATNFIRIRVEDHGAGIDQATVERLALKLGRTDLIEGHRAEEILFESGASTAERLTLTSGRGVGLGAIRETARQLGGDAVIRNREGGGTLFEIVVPDSMTSLAPGKAA